MAAGSTLLPASPRETVDHAPDRRFDSRRLTLDPSEAFGSVPGPARGQVIAVVQAGDTLLASKAQHLIEVSPAAVLFCFVDQPPHLAKSVMVE